MKYIIGRGQDCEIKIDNPKISSAHCSIEKTPEGNYLIEDLDSSNHTYLNGHRIKASRYSAEDKLMLADKEIEFYWLEEKVRHLNNDYCKEFTELKNLCDEHEKKLKAIDWKYNRKSLFIRIVFSLLPLIAGLFMPSGVRTFLSSISGVLVTASILYQQRNSKLEIEKKEENRRFLLRYKCPKCATEFGSRDWFLIENEKYCKNCKARFV